MNDQKRTIITVCLLVVLPLFGYLVAASVKTTTTLRDGCGRTNITREQFYGLLDDLVKANKVRIEAEGSSPSEKRANRQAMKAYAERRDTLLASVSPADPSNPIYVDCEQAYPMPWPVNTFE